MKLSYLGINNTFKDMSVEAGEYTTNPSIIAKINFASEALAKWSAKYPGDPDLARSYYLGVLVLRKVYTQPMQAQAWQYIQYIIHHFPNTFFSKTMLASIKGGFTEHWFGEAQPCQVPGVDPTAAPSAAPSKPGQPSIDILAPPCIQAATPEPAAEETPTPTPAPRGRNAPAPVVTNPPATSLPPTNASPAASASPSPKAVAAAKKAPAPKASGTPVPGPWPPPPH